MELTFTGEPKTLSMLTGVNNPLWATVGVFMVVRLGATPVA